MALVLLTSAGCATVKRPKELVALEALRAAPALSDPDRRAFDLLAAADVLLVQSIREWEARDAGAARRDALMGQIKLKTALAVLQAERAEAQIAELDANLAVARDEEARLEDQLATAQEEVALLARLGAMKAAVADERRTLAQQADVVKKQAATERQRLAAELAAEKRRAEALDGVRRVELALKTAETVDAPVYAKAKFVAASGMLQDAHKQFDAGNWDDALARATLAASEAASGIALARPLYEQAAKQMSTRARDRDLEADASAIPGVEVRLDRAGDLQRLVFVIRGLFGDRGAALRPDGAKPLDAVKDLLAKYPSYPLQLVGYSDGHGKPDDLAALALARANAVYWALVGRGIDPKRMTVEGRGPAAVAAAGEPAAAATAAAAADGARIELAILYHITE